MIPTAALQHPPQQETLTGTISRVVFHSLENGFSVLQVRIPESGHVTVVGVTSGAGEGDRIEATGGWHHDRRFGRQFKAELIVPQVPTDGEGLVKYLTGGKVAGIGRKTAERLVETFGEEIFEVAERQPELLAEVKGMNEKRAKALAQLLHEERGKRDVTIALYNFGVGPALAGKVLKRYGLDAIAVLRHNPYQLIEDIHGVGFKTADGIAQTMGLPPHSPFRIAAGIQFALAEAEREGHCALPFGDLVRSTATLLAQPPTLVQQKLVEELGLGNLIQEQWPGEALIYTPKMHRAEAMLASRLRSLADGPLPWGEVDVDARIAEAEENLRIKLSGSQREAIATALASKVTVITGGPGRGKTTILRMLTEILGQAEQSITLCAPTGRAAKRLAESTGREAGTIHRTLEFDGQSGRFRRNAGNPLTADVVILDEASMCDVKLMFFLVSAVPAGAAFVIVGDADQLPSIGPGNVLNDIICSGTIPTVVLTEIFRQARESRIVTAADEINRGILPELYDDPDADLRFVTAEDADQAAGIILDLATRILPDEGFDPMHDIQVVAPMRAGLIGTNALNDQLQRALNPPQEGRSIKRFDWWLSPGDKVMQTVNNYDKLVFNGDVGVIEEVNTHKRSMVVNIDGRQIPYAAEDLDQIVLAYAATIHKLQGSECRVIIMPVSTSHYIMLQRNLIYTGLTRGKQLVYMVGQKQALAMAVDRADARHRFTKLLDRLKGAPS